MVDELTSKPVACKDKVFVRQSNMRTVPVDKGMVRQSNKGTEVSNTLTS